MLFLQLPLAMTYSRLLPASEPGQIPLSPDEQAFPELIANYDHVFMQYLNREGKRIGPRQRTSWLMESGN